MKIGRQLRRPFFAADNRTWGRGWASLGQRVCAPQPTSVKSVGGKKLLACELLHGRMDHPVLTAGDYGGASGRLPGARTGLKDRCQFTLRAPREMRRRCLQSQTKEAGHDQFPQVNRWRLYRRYPSHVRPGHVHAGLS
jgi:hypothetical protein